MSTAIVPLSEFIPGVFNTFSGNKFTENSLEKHTIKYGYDYEKLKGILMKMQILLRNKDGELYLKPIDLDNNKVNAYFYGLQEPTPPKEEEAPLKVYRGKLSTLADYPLVKSKEKREKQAHSLLLAVKEAPGRCSVDYLYQQMGIHKSIIKRTLRAAINLGIVEKQFSAYKWGSYEINNRMVKEILLYSLYYGHATGNNPTPEVSASKKDLALCSPKSSGSKWAAEDIKSLKAYADLGVTVDRLAEIFPDRTEGAIKAKLNVEGYSVEKGIPYKRDNETKEVVEQELFEQLPPVELTPVSKWTEAMEYDLITMVESNMEQSTVINYFQERDITVNEVAQKMDSLGVKFPCTTTIHVEKEVAEPNRRRGFLSKILSL